MNVIKLYRKNIVENKNIIVLSIIVTILIRLAILYFSDTTYENQATPVSFLWTDTLVFFFSSGIISFITSTIFVFIIAFYASHINEKHALIRNRTYLIYLFGCLIFSSHPVFIYMSPYYIAALGFLACTDLLYTAYQDKSDHKNVYAIGFIIGLCSLFSLFFLYYFILFWIGFSLMRIFSLKKIMISIIGSLSIYWLVFVFYIWKNNIDGFTSPFKLFYPVFTEPIVHVPLEGQDILVIISLLLTIIISLDYQTNSFKDKIRVRANIQFLNISSLFSILSFFFIVFDPTLNLYIISCSILLILSHFFSLAEQKWKVIAFYILALVYFSCCVVNLLN